MTEVDTAPQDQTPYDRVGGGSAVRVVVDDFYERVLGDPSLAPYFTNSEITNLKRHQVQLFSQLLGGPVTYEGNDLKEAHSQLAITSDDYVRVTEHLVAALTEAEVPAEIILSLGETVNAVAPDIISEQN